MGEGGVLERNFFIGTRVKEIIQAAELADEAGLDVFGLGEASHLNM